MLFRHFDDHERECVRCLDAGLVLPAYDYVLKCSHAFNLLDARGVISVTERGATSGACATSRARARGPGWRGGRTRSPRRRPRSRRRRPRRAVALPDLLLEVGCEELPSSACREILEQAGGLFAEGLGNAGFTGDWPVQTWVAPRRFALFASVPSPFRVVRPAGARSGRRRRPSGRSRASPGPRG